MDNPQASPAHAETERLKTVDNLDTPTGDEEAAPAMSSREHESASVTKEKKPRKKKGSKRLITSDDIMKAQIEARQVPPRLVFIPRDENYRANMDVSNKSSSIQDNFSRFEESKKSKMGSFKNPPIPCVFYPWFKDHAKLMIYFHGIGEDLHVIK